MAQLRPRALCAAYRRVLADDIVAASNGVHEHLRNHRLDAVGKVAGIILAMSFCYTALVRRLGLLARFIRDAQLLFSRICFTRSITAGDAVYILSMIF